MSIVLNFAAVTPETLDRFVAAPDELGAFLYPDKAGENPGELFIDVDKAWHGIHFLLCGQAEGGEPPLSDAVLGGTVIDEDLGYGPARFLTAGQVKQVAVALEAIDSATLASRFDPAAMSAQQVYPQMWSAGQEALDYLLEAYNRLREFYARAGTSGYAVLLFQS